MLQLIILNTSKQTSTTFQTFCYIFVIQNTIFPNKIPLFNKYGLSVSDFTLHEICSSSYVLLFLISYIILWIKIKFFLNFFAALKRAFCFLGGEYSKQQIYLELVYLVTALVPSETACLANSPGRRSLTAVWISLEVMVDLLL